MRARDLLRSAVLEIAAHRGRSALTCLSLSIGIAAMVYTFAQTSAGERRLAQAGRLFGPGRLIISAKQDYKGKGLSKGLTWQDAKEIRRNWPELYMVSPWARRRNTRLKLGTLSRTDVETFGITEDWRKRDWVFRLRGRMLDARDVEQGARVCVLLEPGGWVHKPFWAKYFPEQALEKVLKRRDLLGKELLLEGHVFTVVGILKEPPRDQDPRWRHEWHGEGGTVYVPLSSYQRILGQGRSNRGPDAVEQIDVETGDAASAGLYLKRCAALLDALHRGEKDYQIRDYRTLIASAMAQMREFALAVLVIGIVAILASGIGIMNVTLATIFSRIREIGIRRALGATRLDIVSQFVAEAMMLGAAGGAGGLALGLLAAAKLNPNPDRPLIVEPLHMAAALAVAVGTGFLFSLYPACQASRFDPVEALHYE